MRPVIRKFCGIFAILAALAGPGGASLSAQPTGGSVAVGSATIAGGAHTVTITQSSDRAIINWQTFSSLAGDTVRFIQPNAASATLNRVLSGEASVLDGALEANGRVFLINPNGILIGAGARIDTAGFAASTLDVADQEFLAGGDLHFSGDSNAAVVNLGAIDAAQGDVFLIARRVENAGTIAAANGTAGLAAGSEILLTTGGDERLFVQAASSPVTVVNSGELRAATAELKAAGGNAYALAINNSGLVRATGRAERGGQIWLVASGESTVTNAGTIDASSATGEGGRIAVTGGHVLLDDGARIDASGATGGGEVYVGGGWQGKDETIANASAVVMRPTAAINVSATQAGNGGTAVIWSQDYTNFLGHISATGGPLDGKGGDVETSSHGNLQAVGVVDTGGTGQWLLDPWNVTIADVGASGTAFANTFTPAADSVILASSIAGALNGGSNVTITTGASGSSSGNINVNAPISWTSNSTLTLSAYVDINVNANITATGATAGLVLTPNNPSNSYGGLFTLNNRASITLTGATPSLTISGQSYTVINSLGAEGDATTAPGTPSLQGLAAAANLSGRFALGSNIDASATSGWNSDAGFTPIGTATARFTGTFNGLGHTITGLTIQRPTAENVGLFGYLGNGGVLWNTGLVDASVAGKSSVGGLVGYNYGVIHTSYVTGTVTGIAYHPLTSDKVGGIAGTNANKIDTSYSTAEVSGTTHVGGLVGYNDEGTIQNAYATGKVSGTTNVGGLVGYNYSPNGLSPSTLEDTYATGEVSGTTNVGGVAGFNENSDILRTYATGKVSGTTAVGGLVGKNLRNQPGSDGVTSGYWNLDTTGQTAAVGDEGGQTQFSFGRTNAEMMQKASFPDFTISNTGVGGDVGGGINGSTTWRIYEGQTTPWLLCFLYPDTVTVNSATKTYDGAAYTGGNGASYSLASPNPALSGTLAFGGTAQSAVNAGSYTLTASGLYSVQQGYDISYVDGSLTINKANLALSGTRVYNGATNFAGSNLTATGVNGETFTVTGAGALGNLSTKNVQTDQLLASVAGLALGVGNSGAAIASNYNALSTVNSSVSVTPAPLTIYGFAAEDKVYDGNTTAVITTPGVLSGIVGEGGDDVGFTYTDATFDTKDVGTAKTVTLNGVTLNGADKINYTYTAVTTEQSDITPATLTYTADLASRTYGSANPAFTGTVTGFVPGETEANATTGTAVFTTTATVSSNVGTYAINGSGLTANHGNYDFEQADENATALTINPANLVLTGTRVYDGTTFFGGSNLTATGVNGETFTVTGAGASGNLGTKNVQTDQLLASVSGLALGASSNGGLASNYNGLSTTNSSVSVTAVNLSVSTSDVIKTYDGTTTATGNPIIVAGQLFGSDALASGPMGTSFAYIGKDVGIGNKTVTIAGVGVSDGNNGHNYNLTLVNNTTSTINPYAVDLTGARAYDGTANVASGIFAFGTLVGSETLTLSGTGTVALKDVSANQTVNVTGLTLGDGTGLASNYTFTGGTQTASITPANLVLTGTRVYDGTTLFGGSNLTATGVNGETFTVTGAGASGNLATKHVQTNQLLASVGGLALGTSSNGGPASNYHALSVTGSSVSVTPAALSVTANNATKTYGQATTFAGTEFTSSGLQTGDTIGSVSLASSGASATASVTGSTYAITASTAAGGTFAASDYTISYVNGALTVTPAVLTITANNASKVYGQTTTFTGTEFTTSGLQNGEAVGSVSLASSGTAATAGVAGSPYTITPSAATGGTFAASDYTISYVNGALTVTPATLAVTATNATKAYGLTTTFTGTEFTSSGLQNGESIGSVSLASSGAVATAGVTGSPYAITAAAATGGNFNAANYTLSYVPGVLTITPISLTITANDASKTVGQTTTFTGTEFTATGLQNGETIGSVTLTSAGAVATATAGGSPYAITPSAATGGTFNPANYTLSYVNGVLTVTEAVTPPPVTKVPLTITADDKAMTFGGSLPTFTASFNGFINGDTSASVTGLQFSTTATIGSNVGTYTITPFGAAAPAYYLVGYVPGVLTINPALLTITANDVTRSFGATTPGFTASYAGFVNGNTSSVVSGLTFSTVATGLPDDFTIIPGGATAQNYTILYVNGLLHILMPVVPVGGNDVPVLVVDGEPLTTPSFAVIEQNGQPVLVSLGGEGTLPPGNQLAITLGEATNPPPVTGSIGPGMTGFRLTGGPNFGNFELVASSGGTGSGAAQADPGLFRETSLNLGGFNIVYHEPADEARQQDGEHASVGSSYREFPDTDNPQTSMVRSRVERKSGGTADGTGGNTP